MLELSQNRAFAQVPATSIKSKKLTSGDRIKILDVKLQSVRGKDDVFNDVLICEGPEGTLSVPLREYFKFKFNDSSMYTKEGVAEGTIKIHTEIEIVESKDRTDNEGDVVYPSNAYNDFVKVINQEMDYDYGKLKASGFKAGFEPVQDYTVRVI
jgi:hypothetical protein